MRTVGALLFASAVVLAGCQSEATTATTGPSFAKVSSASASGHVEKDFPGSLLEKFSFNAHFAGNGDVVGRFVVSDVYSDGTTPTQRLQGDVICMSVEPDGKTARMGGIITQSNDANYPEGRYAIWVVQDNGEGANAGADKSTDLSYGYSLERTALRSCGQFVEFPPFVYTGNWGDNLRANVQVRP